MISEKHYKAFVVGGGDREKSPVFMGNTELGKTLQSMNDISLSTTES